MKKNNGLIFASFPFSIFRITYSKMKAACNFLHLSKIAAIQQAPLIFLSLVLEDDIIY